MSSVSSPTATLPPRVAFTSFSAAVSRIQRLGDNFARVTFVGEELADFHAAGLDQRVKLIFPLAGLGLGTFPRGGSDWFSCWRDLPDNERCPMRTYTVRAMRHESRELDIDFVTHGDSGPATRWVNRADVGDELLIIGPDGRTLTEGTGPVGGVEFRPGNASRLLLAGDETAAPAIGSILEHLPADAVGQAFIEVATERDILTIAAPAGVTVTWLARDRHSAAEHGGPLGNAVQAWVSEMVSSDDEARCAALAGADLADVDVDTDMLWEVPATDGGRAPCDGLYAWIAGEAGCIKELRRFLVRDTGMARDSVAFMGYWRTGKSEN